MRQQSINLIDVLAQRLRFLWVQEYEDYQRRTRGVSGNFAHNTMPIWDGGPDGQGIVHEAIWPKLARLVLQHDLDPIALMRAVFREHKDTPPLPSMLLGRQALRSYHHYKRSRPDVLRTSWQSQVHHCQLEIYRLAQMVSADDRVIWFLALGSIHNQLRARSTINYRI